MRRASEINISCGMFFAVTEKILQLTRCMIVIENKDAVKALNVIHDSCLTFYASPLEGKKFLPSV